MKITAKILSSLIVGSFLIGGVASAAQALPSVTVKFQDLNLNSNAGIATLYQRIHSAAESVCPLNGGARQLGAVAYQQKCVQSAQDRAVRNVNVTALSAYYQAKTGRAVASMAANTAE